MHSRLLNDTTSKPHLEEEEEALGSCARALYAVEEPHSSRSDMTSKSVYLCVIATSTCFVPMVRGEYWRGKDMATASYVLIYGSFL